MRTPEEILYEVTEIRLSEWGMSEKVIKAMNIYANEYHKSQLTMIDEKLKEPYFGYCDVEGCNKEGCSGGLAWCDTGYWIVCSEHSASYRLGNFQPIMKLSAIEREGRRNKKNRIFEK